MLNWNKLNSKIFMAEINSEMFMDNESIFLHRQDNTLK